MLEKLRRVLEKIGWDYELVSDDPDFESDYGVDANGYLVVRRMSTIFKFSEIDNITYYANDKLCDENDYIHFHFKNNDDLYDYGFEVRLNMGGHSYREEISYRILYGLGTDCEFRGDFLIDNDGTLLCYIGKEKNVEVPDGIKEIGASAFEDASIESVKLPETVKIIGRYAFFNTTLKSIDLNNVEKIGANAFRVCKSLTEITLPKSINSIGKEAFYCCSDELINNIRNESSVELTDEIVGPSKS